MSLQTENVHILRVGPETFILYVPNAPRIVGLLEEDPKIRSIFEAAMLSGIKPPVWAEVTSEGHLIRFLN